MTEFCRHLFFFYAEISFVYQSSYWSQCDKYDILTAHIERGYDGKHGKIWPFLILVHIVISHILQVSSEVTLMEEQARLSSGCINTV